jgi:ABC-type branched-subunit amino acid transport system substrate-binding protein
VLVVAMALPVIVAGLVACGSSSTSSSAAPPPPGPTVNIGYVYPTDQADAMAGNELRAGALFAETYINSLDDPHANLPLVAGAGLVGGAKINIIPVGVSSRCAMSSAFRMLRDDYGVVAIVGSYQSTYTLQGIGAADLLGVPFINDSSSAASLTQPGRPHGQPPCGLLWPHTPSKWFFRVGGTDEVAANQFVGGIMLKGLRPRTAAFLGENSDLYGDGAAKSTQDAVARAFGIRLQTERYESVQNSSPRAGSPTCSTAQRTLVTVLEREIAQLQRDNPDILFVAAYQPDAVAIVQIMAMIKYHPLHLYAYGAGFEPDMLAAASSPGMCGLSALSPSSSALLRNIVVRTPWIRPVPDTTPGRIPTYFARLNKGMPMPSLAAAAFTAVLAVGEVVDQTHSIDPSPTLFVTQMERLTVPGTETIMNWPAGISFDDTGLDSGELHQNANAVFAFENG